MEQIKFSAKEQIVYKALSFNEDTPISELYAGIHPGKPAPALRSQQMIVGKYISRLNEKLTGSRAAPGVARASYRLYFAKS